MWLSREMGGYVFSSTAVNGKQLFFVQIIRIRKFVSETP